MKKHILVLIALLVSAFPSALLAFSVEEAYIYPFFDYLWWEERAPGLTIVDEDGARAGLGVAGSFGLYEKSVFLRAKGELFGGDVDHNRNLGVPIRETEAAYFGIRTEADLSWRHTMQTLVVEPFAGFGYEWWQKRIKNTSTIPPVETQPSALVPGFAETWENYYVKFGVRSEWQMQSDMKIFAEAGGKYPFYSRNETDITGFGWTKLEPEGDLSAFAELGARYKWLRPSIFYEGLRYSESDIVSTPLGGLQQGETEIDIIGFKLGFYFK